MQIHIKNYNVLIICTINNNDDSSIIFSKMENEKDIIEDIL